MIVKRNKHSSRRSNGLRTKREHKNYLTCRIKAKCNGDVTKTGNGEWGMNTGPIMQ